MKLAKTTIHPHPPSGGFGPVDAGGPWGSARRAVPLLSAPLPVFTTAIGVKDFRLPRAHSVAHTNLSQ